MRILITGASGFMGSNMIKFLKDRGHFVRAVGRKFNNGRSEMYKYADEIVATDLREFKSCLRACESMDYVIHLAADMGGVGFFNKHDYTPFMVNMTIDMNILQVCELMNIKRLYYAASACMYPIGIQMTEGKAPMLEENLLNYPADSDQMYGWEKLMMTKLCERSPLDARVGIQHTIFGPYQETEGERMKFPTSIATKCLRSKQAAEPVEIWGNGKQIRTFTYIDDALEKIYEVLMSDEYYGPVNIGTEEEVSVTDVAKMCAEIVGITKPKFNYTTDKPSGVLARGCSNKKWNTYYKYRNKYTTREGFEKLIEWIKEK